MGNASTNADPADVVAVLLDRHGRTYADELGLNVTRNTPSPLFGLLCAALLFSARISAPLAVAAAQAVRSRGWRTADKLAAASWDELAAVLNDAGYARFNEQGATRLQATAAHVCERYRGDLRRLRQEAGHDPADERKRLKECKGIGETGADIFFREAQTAWEELAPFADRRSLASAERLGLGGDPQRLAELVGSDDLSRLVAALVRMGLAGDEDELRRLAEQR
jgi:hypothetical protein